MLTLHEHVCPEYMYPCYNIRHYATHMHNMLRSLMCFVDITNFNVIDVCVKQLKQFSRGPQHMKSANFSNVHYNIRSFLQQTRTSNDVSRRIKRAEDASFVDN